jgi:trans-aconitate 2-methyltransferase
MTKQSVSHNKSNQKNYTWDSRDYLKHSSAQYQWAEELVQKLHLKKNESVLDIGCGDGKVTALIASHVPEGKVTGIDTSENMIAFAQNTFTSLMYPNLRFLHKDAAKLDFQNEFDAVFSNATLHWIKDHLSVLQGVRKSLTPSGRILFQMGGKGNAEDILCIVEKLIKQDPWKKYFTNFSCPYTFCSPEEYDTWLHDTGFIKKRLELIPKDMVQKGKEGLAGWIRTTWLPYTERLPEKMKNTFIEEIINRYLKEFPADIEDQIHLKMKRLEVEAVPGDL